MLIHAALIPVLPIGPHRSAERVAAQRRRAREALAHLARICDAPGGGWDQSSGGVPLPNAGWHWSISHKPLMAAAVIARRHVGIDIEHVAPRSRDLHDSVASDVEWLRIGGRDLTSFFRMWTAKEATLKACGSGIAHLMTCSLTDVLDGGDSVMEFGGRRWRVEHFAHGAHIAAVSRENGPVRWHVLETDSSSDRVRARGGRDLRGPDLGSTASGP